MKNKQKKISRYNGFWKWFFYLELLILIIFVVLSICAHIEGKNHHNYCSQAIKCYDIGNKKHSCIYCIDSECKKTGKIICYY